MNSLKTAFQNFRKDKRATIAAVMGLSMVPIMGMSGAAIDFGRAIKTAQTLQAALDAATLSGAILAVRNRDERAYNTFHANLPASKLQGVASVNFHTTDNLTLGSIYYGEASITIPTAVMKLLGIDTITITRKASAQFGTGDNSCILTLGGELDLEEETTTFNGSPNVNLKGCTIRSNKSMKCNGHNTGAVASIAAGNIFNCPNAQPGAGTVPDIYSGLSANIENRCGSQSGNNSWTGGIQPTGPNFITVARNGYNEIHVCGNLNISGSGILAGTSATADTVIVVENGNVNIESDADITALRTTIVIAGQQKDGKITFPKGNGHKAKLTVSGSLADANPWAGIAIYQDPNSPDLVSASWGPGASLIIDGINYLPRTEVTLSGVAATGASNCSKLVSHSFRINGGVNLTQDGSGCKDGKVTQFNTWPRLLS